jgi:uncharacterized membrane protein
MVDATQDNSHRDQRVERIIGHLLRAGVIAAALVSLVGGIPYILTNGSDPIGADYNTFRGEPSGLRYVGEIVAAARRLDARAVVQLGLVILILTPVARVAFMLIAFLLERDWTYVIATLFVLAILVAGLVGFRL